MVEGPSDGHAMANQPNERPPAAVLLGREVVATDGATGDVKLRFLARQEFTNRHGTIQGGFLSAIN